MAKSKENKVGMIILYLCNIFNVFLGVLLIYLPIVIFDVDISSLIKKVSHRINTATLSCHVQGSILMEKKETFTSSIYTLIFYQWLCM